MYSIDNFYFIGLQTAEETCISPSGMGNKAEEETTIVIETIWKKILMLPPDHAQRRVAHVDGC